MDHSNTLNYSDTFLSSLKALPKREYQVNFVANWTLSRPIVPTFGKSCCSFTPCAPLCTSDTLDQNSLTINFSKDYPPLEVNSLDFIRSVKLQLSANCSLLKKGKVLNDWKCLEDYSGISDNDTLTVYVKSSNAVTDAPLNAATDAVTDAPLNAKVAAKDQDDDLKKKKEFIKELHQLLLKYSVKNAQEIIESINITF